MLEQRNRFVEIEKGILFKLDEIKRSNFRPINIFPKLEEKCIIPDKVKFLFHGTDFGLFINLIFSMLL